MSKILIIGAQGFARELLVAITQADPLREIAFYDDVSNDVPEKLFGRFMVFDNSENAMGYLADADAGFALGIGKPDLRSRFFERFTRLGGRPITIVSPTATIGAFENDIGEGSCVLSNAVIETGNRLGQGCLIHVGALISHDVRIGQFCEISPRASLLGNVTVGDRCSLGSSCVILPGITIGNDVKVGAGAVVTRDVPSGKTVVGIPARER